LRSIGQEQLIMPVCDIVGFRKTNGDAREEIIINFFADVRNFVLRRTKANFGYLPSKTIV
jgi:hypothetical protein